MIIAISTNKGGCLKTSITTNLAGAYRDKKILIVDTDNQGNCLLSFGKNPDDCRVTLYDVLVGGVPVEEAIVNVHKNIDILPANDEMAFFDLDVLSDRKQYPNPFILLKKAMERAENDYDLILVDTPPNLGLVQGNVLTFAHKVLIPFQPEKYSMRSLIKIIDSIRDFKEQHNKHLDILGVIGTLVDSRTILHAEVLQECRKYCQQNNIHMFDTVIPRSVRFAAAVAYDSLPATIAEPNQPAVKHYFDLLQEVQAHV